MGFYGKASGKVRGWQGVAASGAMGIMAGVEGAIAAYILGVIIF